MTEHDNQDIFEALETVITKRMLQPANDSYVASLNAKGLDSILKKIGEEATEVIIAAKSLEADTKGNESTHQDLVYECSDLLFHLMVLLGKQGINFAEIKLELARRFGQSGIVEKASRVNK